MIVVVGSRHDPVATDLVNRWPDAALCSAEDLTRPGWVWPCGAGAGRSAWVVDGAVVDDARVTGVFLRRASVYAEELSSTHPDDRSYLAAEAHAFLVHVLHHTGATVVNPVDDGGSFGEAALRPEHWMAAATSIGVPVAPLRVRSDRRPRHPEAPELVEVVATAAIGAASAELGRLAVGMCLCARLRWAVVAFDRRARVVGITTTRQPSDEAADHLGTLLGGPRAA